MRLAGMGRPQWRKPAPLGLKCGMYERVRSHGWWRMIEQEVVEQARVDRSMAQPRAAGLARRLAAMFYDSLVLAAIMMALTAALLVFTDGQRISSDNRYYQLFLLAIIAFFFIGFWATKGRTLGMLAWRLKVIADDGSRMSWQQASLRFAAAIVSAACAGLGYLWMFADPHRRTWHDRLSNSRVVVLPRRRNSANP